MYVEIFVSQFNASSFSIFSLNVKMLENNSKKKSEMVETPANIEVETLIDSPENLLPEEWIY